VAIVTGAGRGLGEVIAGVLAERNYDLVIGARDAASLGRVSGALAARGSGVVPVEFSETLTTSGRASFRP
jgi:short-subunit dehydrogenase